VGKSASATTLLALNAYWAGLSLMWNALHPIVLPALLVNLVPEGRKNTYLGMLTFAGLVIAMVIQPVSGALSDRWISRWGRRRPLMVVGTLFNLLFLTILGWAGGLTCVWVGYLGLQISSNIAQGPLQGLLRDRVPPRQLGIASSIKVFLDLLSLVVASLIAARLMGGTGNGSQAVIIVVLGLLLVCAAATILFAREEPTDGTRAPDALPGAAMDLAEGSRGSYWWLIAQRGLFLLGVYGLQAFGQYYLRDVLQVSNPPQQAGKLLAAIGIGTILFVLAGGWLSDRFGAKRLLYVASGLAASGMLLMVLTSEMRGLYLVGSIVGAGIGLFMTSNWALANRLAPSARAGRFLGLTNVATAGAAALARLEGPAVDALNAARPDAWLGYKGIFVFGVLCILLSTWFLSRVRSVLAAA
jgi:MFS family permease